MTEPSQYFKGRTVQEQMNEVIGYVDVRSAEVATTAIAADVAQVHQDMLDADADAQAAAASAAAAAGTLANAVKKTGEASQSIAGDIAVAGNLSAGGLLTGTRVEAPTPVFNADAANKQYVDSADATKISITDINSYAVGLTGNQNNILGTKTFKGSIVSERSANVNTIIVKRTDLDVTSPPAATAYQALFVFSDVNNQNIVTFEATFRSNGTSALRAITRNSDGTSKYTTIAEGNVI